MQAGKLSKGDRLVPVDHSKINYLPFRRNFYIEVPELARMSEKEVAELRKQLEDVKVGHQMLSQFPIHFDGGRSAGLNVIFFARMQARLMRVRISSHAVILVQGLPLELPLQG